MSQKCVKCGSYAINVNHHGRKPNTDTDLCDVCYWRKRAEGEKGEAKNSELCLLSKPLTVGIIKQIAKNKRDKLEHDLVKRILKLFNKSIHDAMDLGITTAIIRADEWENDIDKQVHKRLPRTVLKELKHISKGYGYKLKYCVDRHRGSEVCHLEIKPRIFFKG